MCVCVCVRVEKVDSSKYRKRASETKNKKEKQKKKYNRKIDGFGETRNRHTTQGNTLYVAVLSIGSDAKYSRNWLKINVIHVGQNVGSWTSKYTHTYRHKPSNTLHMYIRPCRYCRITSGVSECGVGCACVRVYWKVVIYDFSMDAGGWEIIWALFFLFFLLIDTIFWLLKTPSRRARALAIVQHSRCWASSSAWMLSSPDD